MSILSAALMSFRTGGLHFLNVLMVAVPASLVAFALLTLPACCVLLYVSDHLLELSDEGGALHAPGGEKSGIVINHFFWSPDTMSRIPDITPFVMNAIVRETTFCLVGTVSFCLIAYRGAQPEFARVALLASIAISIVSFICGFGFHLFYLDNVFNVTAIQEPVLRAILAAFTWLPCMVGMYSGLLPRGTRLWSMVRFVSVLVGANVLYYCWRLLCMTYFFVSARLTRIVIGIAVPCLMFAVCFQLFIPMSLKLYEHANLHASLLFLLQPVYWGATMCSIVQLTSNDLITGASIGLGCTIFEIVCKVALLNGCTRTRCASSPDTSWASPGSRTCKHPHQKTISMTSIVPSDFLDESSTVAGNEESNKSCSTTSASSSAHATTSEAIGCTDEGNSDQCSPSLVLPTSPEERRKILFSCVVCHSSVVEVIAYFMTACFITTLSVNPNSAGEPPLPLYRTMVLLSLKLLSQCLADVIVACYTFPLSDHQSNVSYCDAVRKLVGRRVVFDVCLLTAFFAIDTHTLLAQFLCPGSSSYGSTFSFLSSILETQRVGVVGQCPSPFF
eukprot:TRINITY_DN29541_c0_g1_i1.p1 TRINITY_DN29541_c0_g1~~TRINITY_DN29541_c0_g1_i1.p1  ORF type:complete len:560 (+),score=49.62 TRINITY_DN29541_c0_g1_i1:50-1729(+)